MTSRAVLHGHLLAILGHDLSFDAVLGQAETLPLGIFFHLEGMRSLDVRILICVNGVLKHVNTPDSYLRERCANIGDSVRSLA